jgi:hypothetical protein
MSANIHSWIEGHLAIRQRAYDTRGATELYTGLRWPRTTAVDVLSIAALFDDAVEKNGSLELRRRWRATRADLERAALTAPNETYLENRTFWRTLETAAVLLDDLVVGSPPPAVSDTLLFELGADRRD